MKAMLKLNCLKKECKKKKASNANSPALWIKEIKSEVNVVGATQKRKSSVMKTNNKKQKKVDAIHEEQIPATLNRCSPKQLFDVIRKMTSNQKHTIKDMGFGRILKLMIEGIPRRLGHYVASVFDKNKMDIRCNGSVIKVDESSIYHLLGISNTGIDFEDMKFESILSKPYSDWRDRYDCDYIPLKTIVEKIVDSGESDTFSFKLDFIILFLSIMVECMTHGRCKTNILNYLRDESDLTKINWCKYVTNRIAQSKYGWESRKNKPFTGALTILTLLYVDSTSVEGMLVDRTIPAIKF